MCRTAPAVSAKPLRPRGSRMQKVAVLSLFALVTVGMYQALKVYKYHNFQPQLSQTDKEDLEMMIEGVADESPKLAVAQKTAKTDGKDCTVPQLAILLGRSDRWLERNGCK